MDNKDDNPKQPPRKIPDLTLFEQANSDFALAASEADSHFGPGPVQTNSRSGLPLVTPARLSTIESEGETREGEDDEDEHEDGEGDDDEDDDEESESDEEDYEYFDSNGFDEEYGFDQFLDDQESNNVDDFMEEDEIDPDELSYEELVALGEFIGVEKRGLPPNEISTCLYESKHVTSQIKNNATDRCVVCQMEYEDDESVAVLRPCEHPFHSECITKWLQMKKVCPICSSEASPVKLEIH